MQRTVDSSFEDLDAVTLVVDCRAHIGAGDRFIAERVFALGVPVVIVVNKVDRLKPGHIAAQMQAASKLGPFLALHPVSAKTGDGIGELREELVALLPEGPQYYPTDQRTDLSVEEQIAELIREQALLLTREEVPHSITAHVEEIDEKVVRASVIVETESQKTILVGKGGSVVRKIGMQARPHRAPPRPQDLPRAAREGPAEVAGRARRCSSAMGFSGRVPGTAPKGLSLRAREQGFFRNGHARMGHASGTAPQGDCP